MGGGGWWGGGGAGGRGGVKIIYQVCFRDGPVHTSMYSERCNSSLIFSLIFTLSLYNVSFVSVLTTFNSTKKHKKKKKNKKKKTKKKKKKTTTTTNLTTPYYKNFYELTYWEKLKSCGFHFSLSLFFCLFIYLFLFYYYFFVLLTFLKLTSFFV